MVKDIKNQLLRMDMVRLQTGAILDERTLMQQTEDVTGAHLNWLKATGTAGISSQVNTFTATGANTLANSWSYFGEGVKQDPTQISITVKTAL